MHGEVTLNLNVNSQQETTQSVVGDECNLLFEFWLSVTFILLAFLLIHVNICILQITGEQTEKYHILYS